MRRFDPFAKGLALLGIAALLAAAPADKNDAKDREALQGTWRAVTSQMDGEKQAEDEVKEHTLVFSAEHFTVYRNSELVMKGTATLDPGQNPRHIDMKLEENPANPDDVGKTLPGIYELKGDELKWCFTLPDRSERPKDFTSESGSGRIYATLKREKK